MKRRDLLRLSALSALAGVAPGRLLAQPAPPAFRIYMVTWRGATAVEKGFRDYLAASKVPVEYIVRDAGQNPKRLAEFVAEIRSLKPDLVYTWGTSATLGIVGPWDKPQEGVRDIPAVFTLVASPVAVKLVPSLAASDRNLTGVSHMAPLAAQLNAIRAYRPFDRLGVIYNLAEQNSVVGVREMQELARVQGWKLLERTFRRDASGKPLSDGIADLVAELKADGAQWLYIGADSYLTTQLGAVAGAALAEKLPTFATTEAVVGDNEAGVLAGLVSKYYSVGQFTAHKAAQILVQKMPPQAIPVETLQRFSFIVRMATAKKVGALPPVGLFNYVEFV